MSVILLALSWSSSCGMAAMRSLSSWHDRLWSRWQEQPRLWQNCSGGSNFRVALGSPTMDTCVALYMDTPWKRGTAVAQHHDIPKHKRIAWASTRHHDELPPSTMVPEGRAAHCEVAGHSAAITTGYFSSSANRRENPWYRTSSESKTALKRKDSKSVGRFR